MFNYVVTQDGKIKCNLTKKLYREHIVEETRRVILNINAVLATFIFNFMYNLYNQPVVHTFLYL